MKKLLVSALALGLVFPTATANALTLEEQLNGSQAAGNSEALVSKGTQPAPVVQEKPELSIDTNNDLHKVRLSENGEAKSFEELKNTSKDLTPAATTTVAATTKKVDKPGTVKSGTTKKVSTKKGTKKLPKTSAVK